MGENQKLSANLGKIIVVEVRTGSQKLVTLTVT